MMSNVTLLAHSTSWVGIDVMSVLVKWPTVKLAELRTHRVISQLESQTIVTSGNLDDMSCNFFSSRAVPSEIQMEQVHTNPYVPKWTKRNKGMTGPFETDPGLVSEYNAIWSDFVSRALSTAQKLDELGVHKQDVSLALNPAAYTIGVLTADRAAWESFIALRTAEGVYPAVRQIAKEIEILLRSSEPEMLEPGDWHTVFDKDLAVSMSKCAMISFNNHFKEESYDSHVNRAKRLIADKHVSTAEHQLQVPTKEELCSVDFMESFVPSRWTEKGPQGEVIYHRGKYVSNVKGWIQLRKKLEAGEIVL